MAVQAPSVGTMYAVGSSSTTALVAFPSTVNPGDVAVMGVAHGGSSPTAISSVTARSGKVAWSQVDQLCSTGNTIAPALGVFTYICDGTEGGTFALVSSSNLTKSAVIACFPGVDLSNPISDHQTLDQTATQTFTDYPSVNVDVDGGACIVVGSQNSTTSTSSPPTGFVEIGDLGSGNRAWHMSYELNVPVSVTGTNRGFWVGNNRAVAVTLSLRSMIGPSLSLDPEAIAGTGIRRGRRRH